DEHIMRLLAGHSRTSSGPNVEMAALAARVRGRPELQEALQATAPWRSEQIRELLGPYLDAFGHRTLEFEVALPTPAEQPERLVEVLRHSLNRGLDAAHLIRSGFGRGVQRSSMRIGVSDPAVADRYRVLLRDARAAYAVREADVALAATGLGALRYLLLE